MKVYCPLEVPINATPAAEPTESSVPPTPQVSVISNHWKWLISGPILRIANITGILSIIDGELFIIPMNNVKYLQVAPAPEKMPETIIRDGSLVNDY
jgi:hypothetical protein